MTAKIFRNSMVVGLSVFLLTVALFMSMLYQYFQEQFTAQLENEAALVSAGVEAMGQDYPGRPVLHQPHYLGGPGRDGPL